MTPNKLFVCELCRSSEIDQQQTTPNAGQVLFEHLSEGLATGDAGEAIHLQPMRSWELVAMLVWWHSRLPTNKLTFILSKLSSTDSVPELLQFSSQYVACAEGKVPYKERPEVVKKGIHAVLPPLPVENQ